MFRQPSDAFVGLTHATTALEAERLGHDAHGESTDFTGDFGHHWCCTSPRSTAHASGNEHQIGALQCIVQIRAGFLSCLLADGGVAAGTQSAGQGLPQLQPLLGLRLDQGLGIGVENAVSNPLKVAEDHAVDGIAAAASNADDLDAGGLAGLDTSCRERP